MKVIRLILFLCLHITSARKLCYLLFPGNEIHFYLTMIFYVYHPTVFTFKRVLDFFEYIFLNVYLTWFAIGFQP
jgi:hypothetical protein